MSNDTAHPASIVKCPFCYEINVVGASKPFCANCGLELSRMVETESDEVQEPAVELDAETTADMLEAVALPEPPNSDTDILNSLGQGDDDAIVDARHRRAIHWAIPTSAFGVLTVAAIVTTSIMLGTSRSDTSVGTEVPASQSVTVSIKGWDTTPEWSRDIDARSIATTDDGLLGVSDGSDAYVLDVATGDTFAKTPIANGAKATVHAAGDMLVLSDGDATQVWSVSDDSEAGWLPVDLADDATLTLRGDVALVATRAAETYDFDIIENDGTLTTLDVPLAGVVPVAATSDTIVWASNRGVAYVTDRDGNKQDDVKLKAPKGQEEIARWVGGDAEHVYVAWSKGDTWTLAVHDLSDGVATSTHPMTEPEHDAVTLPTRNGSQTAVADLVIDATTGAITEAPGTIIRALGGGFLVNTEDGHIILRADGEPIPVEGASAALELLPDGALVVRVDEQLAVTAAVKGGAQGH
ncbi:MAG: hypothetical protein ACK5LO_07650 [Leucobacter sp.]